MSTIHLRRGLNQLNTTWNRGILYSLYNLFSPKELLRHARTVAAPYF